MKKLMGFAVLSVLFAGCGYSELETSDEALGTVEAEARACAVRCAEGYYLTRACTCKPSACTTTGLCAAGYSWDETRCRCVKDRGGSTCTVTARCVTGYTWDTTTCSCVPQGGEACGSGTCAAGQVCCNASCGICTEPGMMCTQQFCDSTL